MEAVDPLRYLLAFVFVLGLLGAFALVLRKFAGKMTQQGPAGSRLAVVETRYLDARRKLVLVRRDGTEHLLLLAQGRELVIESNIAGGMMAQPQAAEPHKI